MKHQKYNSINESDSENNTINHKVDMESTLAFKNAIFLNIMIFIILVTIFELSRHLKAIYFKRLTRKFEVTQRVDYDSYL